MAAWTEINYDDVLEQCITTTSLGNTITPRGSDLTREEITDEQMEAWLEAIGLAPPKKKKKEKEEDYRLI